MKKMKYSFVAFFLLIASMLAASDNSNFDVRSVSLGRVHALSTTGINPAFLSFRQKPWLSLSVHNRFQIKELNTFALNGIFPNRLLDAGLQLTELGYEDYHLRTVRGSFAKLLTSRVALGTNIRYQQTTGLYDENNRSFLYADIGIFFRLNETVHLAFLSENLLNNAGDVCRSSIGVNYEVSTSCCLLLECNVRKDAAGFSSGVEYELMDHFYCRAGLYTRPLTPTFGVSFLLNTFAVDVACDRHQVLGYSTMLGISYQF
jgi:hypothetical protein